MDLLVLEVDGSLRNPYAAAAVVVWTLVLCVVAIRMARRPTPHQQAIAIALFAGLSLTTWPMQVLIGNILYRVTGPQITSVGFWGGPPIWIAPLVSSAIGAVVWLRRRRTDAPIAPEPRASTPAPSSTRRARK